MVDKVIEQRVGQCEKVTLLTHSTAANSVLVAATSDYVQLSARVGKIVNLAPCLQIDTTQFWLPVRDLASIEAFYSMLELSGVHSLFGNINDPILQAFCQSGGVNTAIC